MGTALETAKARWGRSRSADDMSATAHVIQGALKLTPEQLRERKAKRDAQRDLRAARRKNV